MQHWNSYWSETKALNSFAEGEHSQGYVGEIALFWQGMFKQLSTSAMILDIATGNGGLAVLAKEFNANFSVYGSDAANIDPITMFKPTDSVYKTLNEIEFFGAMPSENLSFNDEKFDTVISQFGFEYANPTSALSEINRVLKPNGTFTALIHHHASFITTDCKVGLAVLNKVTVANGLLDLLDDFVSFCQTLENKDQPTLDQQAKFKKKNTDLLSFFKELQQSFTTDEELDWYNLLAKELIAVIMNWRHSNASSVGAIRTNIDFFRLRLQDQIKAAWTADDVSQIQNSVKNHWHSFAITSINNDLGKLCWVVKATKNP